MNRCAWMFVLGVVVAFAPAAIANQKEITPDLAKIKDRKAWKIVNADVSTSIEDGKRVVRLRPKGGPRKGSVIGMALVEGLQFSEGTIHIDLKGNGPIQTSFVGVAFHVADKKDFEAVYFRPFNFMRDEPFRQRAVQYVAWPEHTWEKLRSATPGVYEAAVNPVPDPARWFHARIEVTKKKVSVFVNEAKEPCLVVDRLARRENGSVGLWVDSRSGAFASLKIVPAT